MREGNKDPREIRGRESEVDLDMSEKPAAEDKSPWQSGIRFRAASDLLRSS